MIRTSVPEMSLFQFGFSRRSGDVGEKEVYERQTNRSTSDVAKSKERYEEKRKMLFVKSGRNSML